MTVQTNPIPLPSQVAGNVQPRQLTPEQEGRLRIVTSILDRDRTRCNADIAELVDLVLNLEVIDDEEDTP